MSAATGGLLDAGDRVFVPGVDHHVRAQAFGVGELAVVDVDRAHVQAHGLGVLDTQMTQASYARNDDPFTRTGLRFLDALVRRDAGADQRGRIPGGQMRRYVRYVVRVREDVLGEATVFRVAAELSFRTHRFARREAIFAMSTGGIEPGHTNAVPFFHGRDTRADGGDYADTLMARDERQRGLQRPVPVCRMQIGMTDATGLGLDQHLPCSWRWNVDFLQHQRLAERFDNSSLHFTFHDLPSIKMCLALYATAGNLRPLPASILLMSTVFASPHTMWRFDRYFRYPTDQIRTRCILA